MKREIIIEIVDGVITVIKNEVESKSEMMNIIRSLLPATKDLPHKVIKDDKLDKTQK
jgi:hypothetical protein